MKKITAFAISIIISSSLFANNFSFGVEGGGGINTAAVELSNGTKSDLDFIPTFRLGCSVLFDISDFSQNAYFSSFGLCFLVSILNWIFTKQIKIECWIVFFGMVCVAFFVKFIKLKKLHELFVALGYLLIFAALLVLFILQLSGRIGGAGAAV